ncbi:hypothetical protein [Gilvimarinus polysaccharolyticus]|uniref:hypothetical protein n=1 Tax=Gilvimarinus polysaccharolyticus TaxID=863921 RepID=UPI0006737316|nr:hypothetical protein [Gilvimarinus polysaccharolyticus]
MKYVYAFVLLLMSCSILAAEKSDFNIEKDFVLLQFDSKTDVDDLHTIAAVATLFSLQPFESIRYRAVAGTYGDQEGLYVPSPKLFDMAFSDNWSDYHNQPDAALSDVVTAVVSHLDSGANIWVVEAGQSNFTARWVKEVANVRSDVDLAERIHVVQHSDWNEQQTNPKDLAYVKATVNYQRIPDGNATGNGSPGFKTFDILTLSRYALAPNVLKIWERAVILGDHYNGLDGRYENDAVLAQGLDFSDTVELCWILGLNDLSDAKEFFEYARKNTKP